MRMGDGWQEKVRAFLAMAAEEATASVSDGYALGVRAMIVTDTCDHARQIVRYVRDNHTELARDCGGGSITVKVEDHRVAWYAGRGKMANIRILSKKQLTWQMQNGGMAVNDMTLRLDEENFGRLDRDDILAMDDAANDEMDRWLSSIAASALTPAT